WVERRPVAAAQAALFETVADIEDGVDSGVSSDRNTRRIDTLGSQVRGRPRSGREVQRGQPRGEEPVGFLGERLVDIPGAQAGFDMADRNARVESGEG